MKPLIKICGINELKTLNELIMIKEIDFIGFIFYQDSLRNVSNNLLQQLKDIDLKEKRPVCVYVNASRSLIEETSSYFDNPVLQFHGDETNEFCKSFNKDFWKVIRVRDLSSIQKISEYQDASAILLENYEKGKYGGTGKSFDWHLLENIKTLDMKIIVSGGINIKNVHNAININPWCIDINSGVESSAGVKDLKLINEILDIYNHEI
jgi:phosphoribosylanthranilate isomerase